MFVISSLPREGGGCGGIRGNTAPSQQQTEYSWLLKTWFRADVVRRVLNLWNMDRRDIFIKCLSSLREINPSRRKFVPEKALKNRNWALSGDWSGQCSAQKGFPVHREMTLGECTFILQPTAVQWQGKVLGKGKIKEHWEEHQVLFHFW